MTRRSTFQEHKNVLVFNNHRVLVAMHKSLNTASQAMKIPAQSIFLCCLGQHISCYGYYFRHYEYTLVEITPHEDFGALRVEEYDRMCNRVMRYHHPREMNRRRLSAEKRRNKKKPDGK
ncbi:MAG: hypothetical protein LBV18_01870 [Alistipes sp.]|jgi:hypothetical protein|nr:hypothetical protein [Alistipes sp.]